MAADATSVPEAPRKGDAQIGSVTSSVPLPNTQRIAAALHAKLRSCYEQGLAANPSTQGNVTLTARVAPNGEVSSVDVTNDAGASDAPSKCFERVVQKVVFEAPGGRGATVTIPVELVPRR